MYAYIPPFDPCHIPKLVVVGDTALIEHEIASPSGSVTFTTYNNLWASSFSLTLTDADGATKVGA